VHGKTAANRTHLEVGQTVRKTIQELGGTLPENLHAPETSIKRLQKDAKPASGNDKAKK